MTFSRATILLIGLILIGQAFPFFDLPISSQVCLTILGAILIGAEIFEKYQDLNENVERLQKLEDTTEKAWNELQKRMSAVESKANLTIGLNTQKTRGLRK